MLLAQWWITSLSTEISMVLSMAMVLMVTDLGRMCELYLRKQKQRKKNIEKDPSQWIWPEKLCTCRLLVDLPLPTYRKSSMGQIRSIGVQVFLHYGSDLYLTNDIARHASRSTELTQIKFRWWVFVSIRLKRLSARITSWWMYLYSKWWYTWAFLLKSWNKLLWFFLQLVLVRCCWN